MNNLIDLSRAIPTHEAASTVAYTPKPAERKPTVLQSAVKRV